VSSDQADKPKPPALVWRRWVIRCAWLLAFLAVIVLPDLYFDRDRQQAADPLAAIEAELKARYDFSHVDTASVARMRGVDGGLVIFDVRQPAEYAVSHLDGAIQLDPDISVVDFMRDYGPLVAGRQALFYCSVGRRASRLIARVEKPVAAAGTTVHNLSGGIFRWQANGGPLVTADGSPTDLVHPYNDAVRALMPRPDKASVK
jgi:rhodanese-related sulfurtransferase